MCNHIYGYICRYVRRGKGKKGEEEEREFETANLPKVEAPRRDAIQIPKQIGGEKGKEKMKKMRTGKIIVALTVGLLLSVVLSVGVVVAGPSVVGNVHVAGDSNNPIEGAEVWAICSADNEVRGPVYSDQAGNYGIDLSTTNCKVGDNVAVTGTYSGQSDTNSGEITTLNVGVSLDLAIVCLDIPIPEFATIAMPVAAILGLLFFYNRRKRKKE